MKMDIQKMKAHLGNSLTLKLPYIFIQKDWCDEIRLVQDYNDSLKSQTVLLILLFY